jgi:hypothetical protein
MIRRLVLALLPVAGFALGVALTALAAPAPAAALPLGGWPLAAAVLGCAVLAATAAALAGPPGAARRGSRRPAIPRSTRPGQAGERQDPPTLSGYWRADEPDWPEGEVRREREREEEPAAATER